jgi:hypothetical protein
MTITYKDKRHHWVMDISKHITHEHPDDKSQCGEGSALSFIFSKIGTTNKIAVEFGAVNGVFGSNTYHLEKEGWKRVLLDCEPSADTVIKAWITASNITDLLTENGVPDTFDLLSIDINGNDYYVWGALRKKPRVVLIEYNPMWSGKQFKVIKYNPNHEFDNTRYFGASLAAMARLGRFRGYQMVSYDGLNAFFIRKDLVADAPIIMLQDVPAAKSGWPPDKRNREWVDIG